MRSALPQPKSRNRRPPSRFSPEDERNAKPYGTNPSAGRAVVAYRCFPTNAGRAYCLLSLESVCDRQNRHFVRSPTTHEANILEAISRADLQGHSHPHTLLPPMPRRRRRRTEKFWEEVSLRADEYDPGPPGPPRPKFPRERSWSEVWPKSTAWYEPASCTPVTPTGQNRPHCPTPADRRSWLP